MPPPPPPLASGAAGQPPASLSVCPRQPSGSAVHPACGDPAARERTPTAVHPPGAPRVPGSRGRVLFAVLETLLRDLLWRRLPLRSPRVLRRRLRGRRRAPGLAPPPPLDRPVPPSGALFPEAGRGPPFGPAARRLGRQLCPSCRFRHLPTFPFWAMFSVSRGRANISRVSLRTLSIRVG